MIKITKFKRQSQQRHWPFYKSLSYKYKALVLDIDGTIKNKSEHQIHQDFIQFIINTAALGVKVCIITARSYTSLAEILLPYLGNKDNIYVYYDAAALGLFIKNNSIIYAKNDIIDHHKSKLIYNIAKKSFEIVHYKQTSYKLQFWLNNQEMHTLYQIICKLNMLLKTRVLKYRYSATLSDYSRDGSSIIISATDKVEALQHFLVTNKLKNKETVKIADMGCYHGADYKLLQSTGSFTVNHCDGIGRVCCTSCSLQLTDTIATSYLLNKLKFQSKEKNIQQ